MWKRRWLGQKLAAFDLRLWEDALPASDAPVVDDLGIAAIQPDCKVEPIGAALPQAPCLSSE